MNPTLYEYYLYKYLYFGFRRVLCNSNHREGVHIEARQIHPRFVGRVHALNRDLDRKFDFRASMSLTFAQARKTSGEKASKQKLLIDYGSFIQIALLFQRKESESNTHGSSLASIVKVLQHMIPHLHRCAQLSCHREIQLLVKEGKVEQVSDGRYRLHPKSLKELTSCNPYYHFFQQQKAQEPEDMARLFDPALDDERRLELFNLTDVSIAEEYSWAIPNDQALKIIQHYGPVIEIGAGKGYWARLLVEHMDVDILCFDSIIEEQSKLWYPVQLGTPKVGYITRSSYIRLLVGWNDLI